MTKQTEHGALTWKGEEQKKMLKRVGGFQSLDVGGLSNAE